MKHTVMYIAQESKLVHKASKVKSELNRIRVSMFMRVCSIQKPCPLDDWRPIHESHPPWVPPHCDVEPQPPLLAREETTMFPACGASSSPSKGVHPFWLLFPHPLVLPPHALLLVLAQPPPFPPLDFLLLLSAAVGSFFLAPPLSLFAPHPDAFVPPH